MADADFNTLVSDVVVPEVFTPYTQQITEEKARLIQSGVLVRNPLMDQLLAGGGLTFNVPSWRDLDNDDENVSSDEAAEHILHTLSGSNVQLSALTDSRPKATDSDTEIAVRLNRNQSWSSSDLAADLAGSDPMQSIGNRVGFYWARRLQRAVISTVNGVSKDNGVNDGGDYANEIVGGSYTPGVTDFSAEAFLDTELTLGDSGENVTVLMVHSVVYNRMKKNNLIDFIPDSEGRVVIPVFLGRQVVVDDGLPSGANVVRADGTAGVGGMYESWLFGPGALQLGVGMAKVPTAVVREEQAGNGGGEEILFSRVVWSIHPVGHAFTAASIAKGGPSNAATANNLNNEASWNRVFPERKQINFARLITRES